MVARFPKRFRLIVSLVSFLIGVTIGSFISWHLANYLVMLALALLGLSLLVRHYAIGVLAAAIAALLLGFSWTTNHLSRLRLAGSVTYHGQAMVESLRFQEAPRQRVVLRLTDPPYQGIAIRAYGYDWTVEPGTKLTVQATITPSQYKSDLGRSIIGTTNDLVTLNKISDPNWIYRFRARLNHGISASLPEPYASFAIGLLTGAGDDFDTNFRQDLQRTGTTHLVAVSGFNLTIVALFLLRAGRRFNRWVGFGLAMVSVMAYIVLAGASPSILRGALVALLSLLGLTLGRVTHRLPILLLSATLLSLITPLGILYSLSWQLSFLAFAGILFWAPVINGYLGPKFGSWTTTLGETLSAEIMTLPLILFQFKTLSIVAPLVNGLVLGFVPLAMALSALLGVSALIWLPLGQFLAWFTYPILFLVVKPIQWSSQLPFAAYQIAHYPWLWFMATYGSIGILFMVTQRKSNVPS